MFLNAASVRDFCSVPFPGPCRALSVEVSQRLFKPLAFSGFYNGRLDGTLGDPVTSWVLKRVSLFFFLNCSIKVKGFWKQFWS